MFNLLVVIIAWVVLPVLINKSTEAHFDWIKPLIREAWTITAIIFTVYYFHEKFPAGVVMNLHERWKAIPWLGYVVFGLFGATICCGYWWFTGKVFTQTRAPIPPLVFPEPVKPSPLPNVPPPKVAHPKPPIIVDVKLGFRAYLQPPEPYMEGTLIGGIVWEKNYTDVRLDIINEKGAVRDLDFLVGLDTSIAGMGQISQFPNVTAFPETQGPISAVWIEGTTPDGKPVSIPVVPTPGMGQGAPVYRVHCAEVFSRTTIHMVIASIALNPPTPEGNLPQQLFAPPRPPRLIKLKGTFEIPSEPKGKSHPVEYSLEFGP